MKNKLILLTTLVIGLSSYSIAQNVSYSKITSPKAFQKHWNLSSEQMKQYENYMEVAGKYRHQNANPLVVLSIISESAEDKGFFAEKAAAYESKMTKDEIEAAWLITQAMEKLGLDRGMQLFTDQLTGIKTTDYIEQKVARSEWKKGDQIFFVINEKCYHEYCIGGGAHFLGKTPKSVKKTVVLLDKKPLDKEFEDLLRSSVPDINIQRYDSIEHHFLKGYVNQAVKVRHNKVIKKF